MTSIWIHFSPFIAKTLIASAWLSFVNEDEGYPPPSTTDLFEVMLRSSVNTVHFQAKDFKQSKTLVMCSCWPNCGINVVYKLELSVTETNIWK